MSYYTVKYIKNMLADLPDDEPVAGILFTRDENWLDLTNETGDYSRVSTPEEWAKIVDLFESYVNPDGFDGFWEALNDAKGEVGGE